MDENRGSRLDFILDLLADEVSKRLQAKSELERVKPATQVEEPSPTPPAAYPMDSTPQASPEPALPSIPEPIEEASPGMAEPGVPHSAPLMLRLAIGVLLIVVLINIPFNTQGTAIARSIPSSASLVIADGLVVKETTSPDIWVYRDGTFHWITNLDAFDYFGYRWQDVHIVEPGFLSQFPKGSPVYVLLKCDASPDIYRLEDGRKRWIVDIPTFLAEGHVWGDVKFVSCAYLRNLPDGDSIPPGRGSPPPPLP